MAPLPVISNVFRCAFTWKNLDWPTWSAVNVMHFYKAGGDPVTLTALLDASVSANMWGQTSSSSSIYQVNVTPLDGSSVTFPYTPLTPAKWKGTVSSLEYTPQVSAVVKMLTGKRGRSYRGRVFLPWCIEDVTKSGLILAATQATMNTAWVAFRTAMDTGGYPLHVASYKLATSEKVVAVLAETNTGTVRKRWHRRSV